MPLAAALAREIAPGPVRLMVTGAACAGVGSWRADDLGGDRGDLSGGDLGGGDAGLPDGRYTVTAGLSGCQPGVATAKVTAGQVTPVTAKVVCPP